MVASSNSLIVTVPERVPKFDWMTICRSSFAPAVLTVLRANRILPPLLAFRFTSHASALERCSALSISARA